MTFLLATFGICSGQNLVPNGDFEQYYGCPTNWSQIDSAKFWTSPTILGSPDYFNQCTAFWGVDVPNNNWGHQLTHSGVGYCGLLLYQLTIPNNREYIQTPLNISLQSSTCYHFEMYVNLGNFCQFATEDIQVYFSDTIITGVGGYYSLPLVPQISNISSNLFDTLNWTLVSGNYNAIGGENYLIIGNFKNDSSTNIINSGGTIQSNAYVYIDDVSLIVCENNGVTNYSNEIIINIFPNPVTDKFTIAINNNEPTEIILYDLSSRKILQQTFTNSTTINTEQLAKGMYLYTVRNRNGIIKNGKVIKQ